MSLPNRYLSLAIGLACSAWQLPLHAQSTQANVFDEYVAGGLPQSFHLPWPDDDARGPGGDDVNVQEKLDADVELPDGSHAITWIGTANGRQATFTRLGDELSVDALEEPKEDDTPLRRSRRSPDLGFGLADAFFAPPAPPPAPRDAGDPSAPGQLQFWIFLHDTSGETNYLKFHNWYIAWWLRDLEKTVLPGVPVKVIVKSDIPDVTDFDYGKGNQASSLSAFRNAANAYLTKIGVPTSPLTKTMLFVADRPGSWPSDEYGIALQADTPAMASGYGPRHIVAHEFGHTLDAIHELAETRFCGVTNMMGYIIGRFACGYYTGANDKRIREHVKKYTP